MMIKVNSVWVRVKNMERIQVIEDIGNYMIIVFGIILFLDLFQLK